jgi:hypothetical protein
MPPQQSDRPLDVFDKALCFCAHSESWVPPALHLAANPAVRNSITALAASPAGTKIESVEVV